MLLMFKSSCETLENKESLVRLAGLGTDTSIKDVGTHGMHADLETQQKGRRSTFCTLDVGLG